MIDDALLEKLIVAVLNHTEVELTSGELRMHKNAVKADMIEALSSLNGQSPTEEME